MVVRDLLTRGLLAGLLAGVLALGVAEILGEPQVSRAIAVETRRNQQEGKAPDPGLVSRGVQTTAGLATGVLVIGTAFGGIFGLAFAFAYGRLGRMTARATALLVSAAGFVGFYLVPFLKYPANPPSVGQPTTIDHRSELYFGMLVISVAAVIGGFVLARRLAGRLGGWNAALLAAGAFVAIVAAAYVLMPGVNEIPAGFPPVTLWRFRLASVATQLSLWVALGLIFGVLTERTMGDGRVSRPAANRAG